MIVKNRVRYLLDEQKIGARLGFKIPTLRIFSLESFGICAASFINHMRPAFSVLHADRYDIKNRQVAFLQRRFPAQNARLRKFHAAYFAEHEDLDAVVDLIAQLSQDEINEFDRLELSSQRKRSIARFTVKQTTTEGWMISRVSASRFQMKPDTKDDTRALVRKFGEAPDFAVDYPDMQRLIAGVADMAAEVNPGMLSFEITLHMMYVFADLMSEGSNAPEGIHQDGSLNIVSALVIERAGIHGGESIVYGPDKKTVYLQQTLQPGEGIFQADAGSTLWHYVRPIREDPGEPPNFGHRSILGFDINAVN